MFRMKNNNTYFNHICILIFAIAIISSCVKHPDSPGYEYSDDMARSQAIEAYVDYGLVADKVNDSLKSTISTRKPPKRNYNI